MCARIPRNMFDADYAVIAGRRFLPRHIPTLHTHTLTHDNTIAQWEIKNNLHNGNSTKSNRMQ